MPKKTEESKTAEPSVGLSELAQALVQAIETSRPKRITAANRKQKGTPWTPKDGSPKLKLKRKIYHHGLEVENRLTNEEIALLNRIKPGSYCDGWVVVQPRKDKGYNVDYKIRTAAQRLKLVNSFGIRNFKELLERIVDEQTNPLNYKAPEDLDTDE